MKFKLSLFLFALLWGCAQEPEKNREQPPPPPETESVDTPYGKSGEIATYLATIGPFIRTVSQAEMAVQEQVGSGGKATGANLSMAMESILPSLRQAQEKFNEVEVPPLLAPLHRDIKKLFVLRIDAYDKTIEGWQQEQETQVKSELYAQAVAKMKEANELSFALNQEMKKIQLALKQTASPQSPQP